MAFVECDLQIRITGSYLSQSRVDRFTNDYEIMLKTLSHMEEVPCHFQGHLSNFKVTKIASLVPISLFLDGNPRFNLQMAAK